MEFDYSNKEIIGMKFQQLEQKMGDNHVEVMDKLSLSDRMNHDKQVEIKISVEKVIELQRIANGRTAKNESWIRGTIMCCSLIIIVVLPLLGIIYKQILDKQAQDTQVLNDRQDRLSQAIIRLQVPTK